MACRTNVLILGGTTEAARLAAEMAGAGIRATVSLAGRTAAPRPLALPTRVGGFGGVEGLATYLRDSSVTHLIDATHPFAATISRNAADAARRANVPLLAVSRPPWSAGPGDDWRRVPDISGAVAALDVPRRRVMLALGRMHLAAFADQPQHRYLLRLVDRPDAPLPLPGAVVEVSRGPFTEAGDRSLLLRHGIEMIVCKNSGGAGAVAKLDAARALKLPVLMIDRPASPPRRTVSRLAEVLAWVAE